MLALLIAAAAAAQVEMLMLDVNCRAEPVTAAGEGAVLYRGISPGGRELALGWERGSGPARQRGAFILNLRTGKRTPLPHLNNAPSFSPNGRFLVSANYAADKTLRTEIVELDRRTGLARTYASAPSGEWLASYAPNGRTVLFNSTRTGGSDIYEINRASGAVRQVTSDPRYEAHASYVDGGRRILFHRQTAGDNYDIVIRDLTSGAETMVGATPLEEAYPAMSPDGRWIAFSASDAPGEQPNLYLMRRDGSGRYRLTSGADKDAYATWSADGRAVYFVRFGKGDSRIYRIALRSGSCRAPRIRNRD
jgi:TolB protein